MDIEEIYNYIDSKGIPISVLSSFGININIEENPNNETYLQKGVIIKRKSNGRKLKFNLPFDLTQTEQENIVLNYLKDTTGYIFDNPHSLLDFPSLNGFPFILLLNEHNYDNRKISLGTSIIPGSLITRTKYHNYGFRTLGKVEKVKGTLGIDSEMDDLGNLKRVDRDLWFSQSVNHVMKTFTNLKTIGGNLNLKNTKVSLGSLESVRGNVNLRKSMVRDLGSLKFVGGNLFYSKVNEPFYDFTNIEIKGRIRGFKDKF